MAYCIEVEIDSSHLTLITESANEAMDIVNEAVAHGASSVRITDLLGREIGTEALEWQAIKNGLPSAEIIDLRKMRRRGGSGRPA